MIYFAYLLCGTLSLVLLAQATDLLGGHSGRMGVSAVLFAAVSAYAYGLLTVHAGWPAWGAFVAAIVVTTAIGTCLAVPMVRLGATGFLIASVCLQLGIVEVTNNIGAFGGPIGLRDIPHPWLTPVAEESVRVGAIIVCLAVVASTVALTRLTDDARTWGRFIHWVRDDQASSEISGLNGTRVRAALFALHALVASLAGLTTVLVQGYVSPSSFDLGLSLNVLAVVYVGGTGGRPSAMLIGAVVVVGADEAVRGLGIYPALVGPIQRMITASALVAVLVMRRRGIAGPVLESGATMGALS